jgi:hypothetical protein
MGLSAGVGEAHQGGKRYGVPWYDVLINAALDLDKTKMGRIEAIDATIGHLQEERRELALR